MISIIHPSRSRPQKSFETIQKWVSRADFECEVIVSLDTDDPEYKGYINHYFDVKGIIVWGNNRSAVDAINNGARAANGDIFIVVSDDTDCPEHWDKIILEAVKGRKDFVLKVADGIQDEIVTMPVMDRTFYNRFGYIYNPIYKHAWCDTELTHVAKKLGRLIKRLDINFPHNHYSVTGEKPDHVYQRSDSFEDEGRRIYNQRKRMNFK